MWEATNQGAKGKIFPCTSCYSWSLKNLHLSGNLKERGKEQSAKALGFPHCQGEYNQR